MFDYLYLLMKKEIKIYRDGTDLKKKFDRAILIQKFHNQELLNPGFPNNHTSIQESSNNYCYFWRASNGLTPRSRYSCSCFIRTSPCAGAFPGSR